MSVSPTILQIDSNTEEVYTPLHVSNNLLLNKAANNFSEFYNKDQNINININQSMT